MIRSRCGSASEATAGCVRTEPKDTASSPSRRKGVATSSQPAASAVRRSWASLRRPISPARAMARSVSPNLVLARHTQPNHDHELLLRQLGLKLPNQPAPKLLS